MTKPLVAMLQPSSGYSLPYAKARTAFLRPTQRGIDRIELVQGTSMLTRCFNLLLCDAVNHSRHHPITHVAMLHDDVAPDGPWLDVLLDEMETTGADMVSAVVPIKNADGVTSTAIDNPGDPWVVRRLTMREVHNLPETFEAKDVPWNAEGGCLLANTGCWLAKLDMEGWVKPFFDPARLGDGQSGFRFRNRVVVVPSTGEYTSQDEPEDWHFSRQMRLLGKKVVCTRKVTLEHGHPSWHNRAPWGNWPTDLAWFEYRRNWDRKPGPEAPEDFRFPSDVPGWLSEDEGKFLARLAEGKDVLEVGCYMGRSTVCLAQTARSVHAVDTFKGTDTTEPRDTLPAFADALGRYGLAGKVTVHVGDAAKMVPAIRERFGLAFVDAGHDYDSVARDARLARSRLAEGGLVAFHDYGRACDEGVTAAVDELRRSGWEFLDLVDTVAVLRPPAEGN